MAMFTPARIAAAGLLAALAAGAAACGGTPAGAESGKGPAPQRIASPPLYFQNSDRPPQQVRTVLRTREDVARFPDWFARPSGDSTMAEGIAAGLRKADLSRNVVVAYTTDTGCGTAGGAELVASGNQLDLRLLDHPAPPPECYAPNAVTALFEVDRDRMPADPVFGPDREAPDPPAPARLVAFAEVEGAVEPRVEPQADVTGGARLDGYLARLPSRTADELRREVAGGTVPEQERRLAFVVSGCRLTGAELVRSEEGPLAVRPVGGETVRCVRAEHYVAVFTVPASLAPVPPR